MSDFDNVTISADLDTSYGALNISFPRMPTGGMYDIRGTTTNAPVNILLPPDYQGYFDQKTTHPGRSEIQWDGDMADPSGHRRERKLEMVRQDATEKSGAIFWGERPVEERMSSIVVRTTVMDTWLYSNYEKVEQGERAPREG